ncbi:MAG: ACP S-malonyltransferase [Solirubrobacterales bacterium]
MANGEGKLAVMFPGQGVGDERSRELVRELRPDLLTLAEGLVGDDPFARLADGTRFAQPAVYCAALAGYERLGRPRAELFAGHSLGEVAALVAAGAISETDGLRIVVERGRLMQEAAEEGEPGGMLALGVDRATAHAFAGRHRLAVANENSPRQLVLSGGEDELDQALAEARESGLRAKRLAVAGPFHSPAMGIAVGPFRELLARIEFRRPAAKVISGVTAAPVGADARGSLAAALTSPVRWVEVLERLHAEGVRRFVDVGPGRVLAGLVKQTLEGVATATVPPLEAAHV